MPRRRVIEDPPDNLPYEIREIETSSDVDFTLEVIETMGRVAIDTETTGLNWALGSRAFMATFCSSDDFVFACYDPKITRGIVEHVEQEGIRQVYQNFKFDAHMLREWCGWRPQSLDLPLDDTMFGFKLKFPRHRAALKTASRRYVPEDISVNYWQTRVKDWLASEKAIREDPKSLWYERGREVTYADVPKDIMLPYGAHDAWLTIRSFDGLTSDGAFKLDVYKQEVELIQLLVMVEKSGWRVKKEVLDNHIQRAAESRARAESSFRLIAPGVNLFSPDELGNFLYHQLGEEVIFTTDKGKPSVGEQAIRRIRNEHLRDVLLEAKKWATRHTQLLGLREHLSYDGCIHTNFKSEAAKTGRFSSEEPNLQNIPQFDKDRPWTHVRDVFGPEDGYEWLLADYSQIEMVIFADYCPDENLRSAIRNGTDLHALTGSRMFGVPIEDLLETNPNRTSQHKIMRKLGKGMNFTILYGAGDEKVAFQLEHGDKEGRGAIDLATVEDICGRGATYLNLAQYLKKKYREGFPAVTGFIRDLTRNVQKRTPSPWVRNKFGRIIPVDRGYEFKALNYIIQGSAADLMKNAMIRSWKAAEEYGLNNQLIPWKDIQLFCTIHDELMFKAPVGHARSLAQVINPAMCDFPQFQNVPIRASFAIVNNGSDWARKEEFHLAA